MASTDTIPVRHLFGIPIRAATMEQTLDRCSSAIEHKRPLTIGMVNAAKIVKMRRDPFLFKAVVDCDLVLADGMAVVWASRILRRPLPERVPGIDLFERLLRCAGERRFSVYFLGATQAVLGQVVRHVGATYPGLRVAGSRDGYFRESQSKEVADGIRRASADMLFVAMTSPKKEVFLARWGPSLGVSVCHGVGGSFDVMAGKVKRAPRLWQRLGLEWLYRVVQEPRRMWKRYLVTNTLFLGMLLRELSSPERRPSHPAK